MTRSCSIDRVILVVHCLVLFSGASEVCAIILWDSRCQLGRDKNKRGCLELLVLAFESRRSSLQVDDGQ